MVCANVSVFKSKPLIQRSRTSRLTQRHSQGYVSIRGDVDRRSRSSSSGLSDHVIEARRRSNIFASTSDAKGTFHQDESSSSSEQAENALNKSLGSSNGDASGFGNGRDNTRAVGAVLVTKSSGASLEDEKEVKDIDTTILFNAACMSFLWSMGSFMVLSLLPVYLREHLGLSNSKIGALEGFAVVASALAKGFSGIVSDLLGSRKLILLLGSAVTVIIKPLFALSPLILTKYGSKVALASVSTGKILDRLGKGLRAAPFDALISDVSPEHKRGRAYGLNYSASTLGAVSGCLIASLLMKLSGNSYSISLSLAVLPPLVATLLLLFFVTEKRGGITVAANETKENLSYGQNQSGIVSLEQKGKDGKKQANNIAAEAESLVDRLRVLTRAMKDLPIKFWQSLLIVCVLYLARFSESFMTIRARSVGMSITKLPLLLIVDQLMQSTLTYPMGALADVFGRKYLLLFGFAFLILANVIFMTSTSFIGMISGYFLVGLHMSMTQCNLKALISTTIPTNMRGSAFSIVGLATGSCLFVGNLMAGRLMDVTISHGFGHIGAFIWGLLATCLATFALIFLTFIEE